MLKKCGYHLFFKGLEYNFDDFDDDFDDESGYIKSLKFTSWFNKYNQREECGIRV